MKTDRIEYERITYYHPKNTAFLGEEIFIFLGDNKLLLYS